MHEPYQQQVQITVHKESWWSVKLAKQTNKKQTSMHTHVQCSNSVSVGLVQDHSKAKSSLISLYLYNVMYMRDYVSMYICI